MMIEKTGIVEPIRNLQNTQKTKQPNMVESSDSISLSPEAQKLSEVYLAIETAKAAPDVREDKIAEVTKKFQDPKYIEKVLDLTADSIIDSLGI